MKKIPSLSRKKATELRKLKQRKYRDKNELFVVEGWRSVDEVVADPNINTRYWVLSDGVHDQAQKLWMDEIEGYLCESSLFDEFSNVDQHQGILAVCEQPARFSLEELFDQPGLIVALDGVQDPGNLGTIIRSAVWFGAAGIVLGKGTVDLYNEKVIRSTVGAIGSLPILSADLLDCYQLCADRREILALMLDDSATPLHDCDYSSETRSALLVAGNEGNGINAGQLPESARRIYIEHRHQPEQQGAESLNVGVATSIALYHLTQR